ncbi:hypothetical protein A2716_00955 [candidate division WWE3 bacterium RIFCSPHIGHO2_01_FULL_40_23]|uniref:Uncharacterized protein n=1 Tax=candidate division WWE3 bacterium RIFCSPLOWO2_01_FULL_41_18 TaxID=1802625 RepID=A0A1F4VF60_UNCKA|nr:MAG: hypothetical protein A2716_00955 [candidate division WWE3 bacterium RIFCSPHIGHO2_01_FULL_40_23]OGC55560.1 MAG: hypothetical protein A3A78_01225 [candidate division WWE3 bacterium RIFCSPLOWO2_01_FULL_41_18]
MAKLTCPFCGEEVFPPKEERLIYNCSRCARDGRRTVYALVKIETGEMAYEQGMLDLMYKTLSGKGFDPEDESLPRFAYSRRNFFNQETGEVSSDWPGTGRDLWGVAFMVLFSQVDHTGEVFVDV